MCKCIGGHTHTVQARRGTSTCALATHRNHCVHVARTCIHLHTCKPHKPVCALQHTYTTPRANTERYKGTNAITPREHTHNRMNKLGCQQHYLLLQALQHPVHSQHLHQSPRPPLLHGLCLREFVVLRKRARSMTYKNTKNRHTEREREMCASIHTYTHTHTHTHTAFRPGTERHYQQSNGSSRDLQLLRTAPKRL